MVDAVSGQAALALLTGSPAAGQTGNRKNPLLPFPLGSSEQTGNQRVNSILRFDTPRFSPDVFSTLQNTALLSASRGRVSGEERSRLEAELRQRITVTETPGTPGIPGTPDSFRTITNTILRLDPAALTDLEGLVSQFLEGPVDETGSRFVAALAEDIAGFADRLGEEAGEALRGIIRRIENSVIGEDGLQFLDIFRDPALFINIAAGTGEFADETGRQAANALLDIVLRIGDRRFYDGNDANDSVRAIGAAIDRLGRALAGNEGAASALQDFLDRLGSGSGDDDAINAYARRIAETLEETLAGLQQGELDETAVSRLRTAAEDIRGFEDIAGDYDDALRELAADGLEGIITRYASQTTQTATVVVPGQPSVPATPGERTVTITQETTLVPRAEVAERVANAYKTVQDRIEPLRRLNEPLPQVPDLTALLSLPEPPQQEDEEEGSGFVIRAPQPEDRDRFGLPLQDDRFQASSLAGSRALSGQYFDTRI